jgi:hypothetical protein
LAVAVIGCAIGICAACSSPDPGGSPSPPAGSSATSPAQASAACAELRAEGQQFGKTLQQYEAGQTSRVQVLAAAENLLHTAQDTLPMVGAALRTQVEQVRSTTQTLVTTLRASPPASTNQVKSAAQDVLDALKDLDRQCAGQSTTPTPTTTA